MTSEKADDDLDCLLEACLNRFIDTAPVQHPRDLIAILTDVPDHQRLFVLIELIKLDLSLAADEGDVRRIQWYLDGLAGHLCVDQIPLDLVLEEVQLRKERGESPVRAEYAARFPQFVDMLDHLLASVESTEAIRYHGPPPELDEGTSIDDFTILSSLGRGAFATVYLARQISMHRLVALKVSRGAGDESLSLAQLDHANIVRIFDQRALTAQQMHLMYMQYLPGGTLAEVVQAIRGFELSGGEHRAAGTANPLMPAPRANGGGILLGCVDRQLLAASQQVPERSFTRQWLDQASWPEVVAWVGTQLAAALDHAHGHGILHRDVKPANVLLTAEGLPKLADFNVSFAGVAGRAGASATFGGSIAYMSPEHLRAIGCHGVAETPAVGPAADLYSLAILLWELWQGRRPFVCRTDIDSWTMAISEQLDSRSGMLRIDRRWGGVSERVLEKVLRQTLSLHPDRRPSAGSEMAGRLRLALHPEAAGIFDPDPRSLATRLAQLSPWLVIGAVLFLPNVAAGMFNFQYNAREIIGRHPGMVDDFRQLSYIVNATFFPFGLLAIVSLARPVVAAIGRAKQDLPSDAIAINSLIALSRRAAIVGGGLWALGGLVFALVLSLQHHHFPNIEAFHFVLSMLICGGVAAVYPYFGMTALATHVYYPLLISRTMHDPLFDKRAESIKSTIAAFLLEAAMIPMLAVILLVSRSVIAKDVIVVAVAASVLGLLASFTVYRSVVAAWERMGEVLSEKPSAIT